MPAQKGTFFITNATIHVGNGTVIQNGTIKVTDGKIAQVGDHIPTSGGDIIDAKGQQVYPGLILPETDLGLKEIANAVRGSNDYRSWVNGIRMCNRPWHITPILKSSIH